MRGKRSVSKSRINRNNSDTTRSAQKNVDTPAPDSVVKTVTVREVVSTISADKRNQDLAKLLRSTESCNTQLRRVESESTQSTGLSDDNSRFNYGFMVEITDSDGLRHDYILGRRIGKGGFSEVRIGRLRGQPAMPRFAVKIVDLRKPKVSRIERQPHYEIELLKRMEHSRYVIRMFESKVVEDDALFMVLELGDRSLEQLMRKKMKNRSRAAKVYFRACVTSIYDVHAMDIVHCDLKPSNFMRSCHALKVIDFGCATPLGPLNEAVIRRKALGTTRFMSPEYLREKIASKSLDVWSLGCILFWLGTGQKAFKDPRNDLKRAICMKPADLSGVNDAEMLDLLRVGRGLFFWMPHGSE